MRPKSIATVVVVLSGACVRSSIPADAEVITASVRSGLISDTAPTNVVLPTPNPPATTIFAEVVARVGPLELPKSTEHPFKQCHIWLAACRGIATGLVDRHQSRLGQVGNEDPDHTERDGQQRGDLRDRLDLPAQQANSLVLRQLPPQPLGVGRGADQGLDGQLVARPGPAARHRVRAHQTGRCGPAVTAVAATAAAALTPATAVSGALPGAVRAAALVAAATLRWRG